MIEQKTSEHIEADIEKTREEMSDTLDAIQKKLSPGKIVDDVLKHFQKGSGNGSGFGSVDGFTHQLTESVRNNPLPVALVGIGLGWLMMSKNNQSSHTPYRGNGSQPQSHSYDTTLGYRATYPETGRQNPAGAGSHSSAQQNIGDAAEAARDKVEEGVRHAQHKAGEAAEAVKDRVSHGVDQVRHKAGEVSESVQHQVSQGVDQVKHQYNHLLHEQPLVLIGMGFAIGAALGAGLPSTRRENQLMGETSDNVKAQAKALGKEQMEKAEAVAGAAVTAAQEQAKEEDLNKVSDNVKEKADEVKDSAKRVAKAAESAARKEVDDQQ